RSPTWGWSTSTNSRLCATRRPSGPGVAASRRPGHFTAAFLDRASDVGAVNEARHLEQVLRFTAARLGVTDKESGNQLVLASPVEGPVRREADFRRQHESLEGFGHRRRIERLG